MKRNAGFTDTVRVRAVREPPLPSATETMAERAWRYGEAGLSHESRFFGPIFPDGSLIGLNLVVYTARDLQRLLDQIDEGGAVREPPLQAPPDAPDWSAA